MFMHRPPVKDRTQEFTAVVERVRKTASVTRETNGASARFQVYCRAALNASKASAETLQTRAGDVARVRTLLEKGAEVCSEPMAQWRAKSASEALQKALGASGSSSSSSSSSSVPEGA